MEVVRTEVELKLRCLLTGWVESCLHLSLELLQIARTLLLRDRCHESILLEVILCYDDGREELVLERYPVDGFFYFLVNLLATFVEVVGTAFCIMVGEGSVTVFEHETTFLLACLVAPVNIHLIIIR